MGKQKSKYLWYRSAGKTHDTIFWQITAPLNPHVPSGKSRGRRVEGYKRLNLEPFSGLLPEMK